MLSLVGHTALLWTLVLASDSNYKLVWEDNFDTLDFNKWEHEVTAWGGGVSNKWEHEVTAWGGGVSNKWEHEVTTWEGVSNK